jgi:large subunit ribosomal protein L28
MSRCELSGKGPVVKNLVSHSNIKTKFKAQPNIQKKQLYSTALGRLVTLQVATSTIRDMEHVGGFDTYVLNQTDKVLSKRALTAKRKIQGLLKRKVAAPKKNKAAASAKITAKGASK